MIRTATFIDFDDSFTFNVVQELTDVGVTVQVVNWKDFETLPQNGFLILGPGPGHPDDYQRIFPLLQDWVRHKKPLFGVCLGHQIFWRLMGEEIVRSKNPEHGQSIVLQLNQEWREWLRIPGEVRVQRYNSLSVMEQASFRNPVFKNFIQNLWALLSVGRFL
jgi:anthranilate synthase component 2